MPFEFVIDPDRRLALFHAYGDLDTVDCAACFIEYTNADAFDPGHVMLTDASGVKTIHSGFTEILSHAFRLKPALQKFQTDGLAVIYAPSSTVFGMARILQQVVEPMSRIRVDVAADEAEALALAQQNETSFSDLRRTMAA